MPWKNLITSRWAVLLAAAVTAVRPPQITMLRGKRIRAGMTCRRRFCGIWAIVYPTVKHVLTLLRSSPVMPSASCMPETYAFDLRGGRKRQLERKAFASEPGGICTDRFARSR